MHQRTDSRQYRNRRTVQLIAAQVINRADDSPVGVALTQQGAQLLIYPTAIGYESSDTPEEQARQREAWTTVQRGHAVANGLPVITVNRVGHEPDPSGQTGGIQFWGSSFVVGPQGELHYQASTDEEESIVVEIDLDHSEQVRRWWPFLRDRRIDHYGDIVRRYIDDSLA